MGGGIVLLRGAEADVTSEHDQRGPRGLGARLTHGGVEAVEIVDIIDAQHLPSICTVAMGDLLAECKVGGTLNRDVVVIVEDGQSVQTERPRERRRLARHALHMIPVTCDHPCAVVDDRVFWTIELGGEHSLGDCEPDRHADPLS